MLEATLAAVPATLLQFMEYDSLQHLLHLLPHIVIPTEQLELGQRRPQAREIFRNTRQPIASTRTCLLGTSPP